MNPQSIPNPTLQHGGHALKFTSWNVKGLNEPVKRSKVLHHLQTLGTHIAFLQETHLKTDRHFLLQKRWVGQVYHSQFSCKARGTAILIHKSVPFTLSKTKIDKNGRYVIVTGTLYNNPVILANVYAPNWDDEFFFKSFFSLLQDMQSQRLILAGDLNCWLTPLDRSSMNSKPQSKSAKLIKAFLKEFHVSDAWRFLNPTGRAYSFFSNMHHTFTRIDYFLLDNRFLPALHSCTYNPIVISDHSPVTLELKWKGHTKPRPPWRFNTRLLSDDKFVKFMSTNIDVFIKVNKTADTSPSILWETFKAFARGIIISYASYEKRQREKRIAELLSQISQLDQTYASSPSPDVYKQRLVLQSEFNNLSSTVAEDLLFKCRYTLYEQGDKASKLLAHQLRSKTSARQILKINTPTGTTVDPQQINDQFKNYYSHLYTSEAHGGISELDSFFQNLPIPSLDATSASDLEQPITLDEISSAIRAMQSGKCPGPDGFPVEFYKKFSGLLTPLLLEMLNESFTSSCLPPSLRQTSISLILKKNKDPLLCSSYRPISLINVDAKLLAKVLAMRLDSILPSLISHDQTGFIKNRHSFFNIRRLFNIIYSLPSRGSEAVVALDAEKAFDRVELNYLFYTLKKFGLCDKFISWIELLYHLPSASVRTNNINSEYFNLQRGTRQGCPLSPLLFAIAIEPLSVALRFHPQISGILRGEVEQRVALYADDLLLFLSNLSSSLPNVLSTLSAFGAISGYKVNYDKSEIFPLNTAGRTFISQTNIQFKVVSDKFTYLGIQVTDKFERLFGANFDPLLTRTKQDLKRWSLLPLSMAGRVNSVKMNILPKFSYLFQCLPVYLTKTFFRKLDSLISEFLWQGRPSRLRKLYLERPRVLGGLALPNFQFYYWAANLRIFHYWLQLPNVEQSAAWVNMEATSCKPSSLPALLYSPRTCSTVRYTKNILVRTTLKIWKQFKLHFDITPSLLHGPINQNHSFPPSLMGKAFSAWVQAGITSFSDLYIDETFASFQQLTERFSLGRNNFFQYLQIRSFIQAETPNFPTKPEDEKNTFLQPVFREKGFISYMYSKIFSECNHSFSSIKTLWEQDLGEVLEEDIWDRILHRVHSSSFCAKHGLIQFKILHRTHWTKERLSKIFPHINPQCDRCQQSPASLIHMFLSCPSLHNFWTEIFNILSTVLNVPCDPTPVTVLFGVLPLALMIPKYKADFVAFATLLARRLILFKWKSSAPPTVYQWLRDLLSFSKLEKIRATLHGSTAKFYKIWNPFLEHLKSIQFPSSDL